MDNDSVASVKRAENGWVLCVKVPSGEEYAMMDQHRMAVFTTVADLTAFLGSVLDSYPETESEDDMDEDEMFAQSFRDALKGMQS